MLRRRPRLGLLGLGRIGLARMEALHASGLVEVAALADPSPDCIRAAQALAPGARAHPDLPSLLAAGLDGLVIATPSAAHAEQAIAALESGLAVFCQKPLGRNAREAEAVIAAAARADRLLGVDFTYRHGPAALALKQALPEIGPLRAADLVFHNSWGPDRPWFFDRAQSGGGCLMDLGIHLIDLLLWLTDWPELAPGTAHLHAGASAIGGQASSCEDHALAEMLGAEGFTARLACSWNQPLGRDCDFRVELHGAGGSLLLANVGGSYHDLVVHLHQRGHSQCLSAEGDGWAGNAALGWAQQLRGGRGFDPEAEHLAHSARLLEALYANARQPARPRLRAAV